MYNGQEILRTVLRTSICPRVILVNQFSGRSVEAAGVEPETGKSVTRIHSINRKRRRVCRFLELADFAVGGAGSAIRGQPVSTRTRATAAADGCRQRRPCYANSENLHSATDGYAEWGGVP